MTPGQPPSVSSSWNSPEALAWLDERFVEDLAAEKRLQASGWWMCPGMGPESTEWMVSVFSGPAAGVV